MELELPEGMPVKGLPCFKFCRSLGIISVYKANILGIVRLDRSGIFRIGHRRESFVVLFFIYSVSYVFSDLLYVDRLSADYLDGFSCSYSSSKIFDLISVLVENYILEAIGYRFLSVSLIELKSEGELRILRLWCRIPYFFTYLKVSIGMIGIRNVISVIGLRV